MAATRLVATLRTNITLQYRYGFYYVSAVFILIRVALLRQIPHDADLGFLVPGLMVNNLILTTFYYLGAQVLLERSEGTLAALVVTPLRESEFLMARVLSLVALGVTESMTLVVIMAGVNFDLWLLVAGMVALGSLYALVGFIAVARYDSLNEFLLPSILVVMGLSLPLVDHYGIWRSPLFYLHPVQPALSLMRAAFVPALPAEIIYGLLGSLMWLALCSWLARRIFLRFVLRTAGA